MEATQVQDAQDLNIRKWMALLRGEYRSESGKDVVIDYSGGSYNGRPMPFNAVTFNGMVTGVLDFGSGGTYLAGKVEAVPTPDGLQLTEVKMNDGEPWYNPAQDNAGIKLSLLEHLNLQLIQSAEREK